MSRFITVAKVGEVAPGTAMRVEMNGEPVALYNLGGEYFATHDICTHAHASLSEGHISGDAVACPLHFATFNIRTGECTGGPAFEDVRTYTVRVEGDEIQIAEV